MIVPGIEDIQEALALLRAPGSPHCDVVERAAAAAADMHLQLRRARGLDAWSELEGLPQRQLHQLKTHPGPFQAVLDLRKTYEIRVNDRDFRVGDILELTEWDPDTGRFTGRAALRGVTYMTPGGDWGLPETLCVLALGAVLQ